MEVIHSRYCSLYCCGHRLLLTLNAVDIVHIGHTAMCSLWAFFSADIIHRGYYSCRLFRVNTVFCGCILLQTLSIVVRLITSTVYNVQLESPSVAVSHSVRYPLGKSFCLETGHSRNYLLMTLLTGEGHSPLGILHTLYSALCVL